MPATTIRENQWFRVEQSENADARTYHSRLRLLDDGWQGVAGQKGAVLYDEQTPIPATLDLVLNIPGVTWGRVTAHAIDVIKASTFAWEEIDAYLMELMYGVKTALDVMPLPQAEVERKKDWAK